MSNEMDFSDLPQEQFGDDAWFAMIVPDEIEKLNRLYRAILKWEQVSSEEFDAFEREVELHRSPQWDRYGYDPLADEAYMLLGTQRVMLANFGVSIAACAENFILGLCKARYIKGTHGKGPSDFGTACNWLGTSLGRAISDLPGYSGNQRARMLGNCFKHSEGKTNERFVKRYGGALGEEIEYEKEDWSSMIEDTRTLLDEITKRLA